MKRRIPAGPVSWGITIPIVALLASQLVMGRLGPVGFGDRSIPAEVLAVGVVVGCLYGLVGVGMVLVWRSHRLINLAQAQLGAVPAVAALVLVAERGWPYIPAVIVALVVAAALGASSERLVVRRFDRAPRLAATIATLGLAQVLVAVEILLPRWLAGVESISQPPSTPFSSWKHTVGVVTFSGDHVAAAVVGIGVSVGVALALRRSRLGLAVRATAARPVQAAQLGVPVARIRSSVWGVAAVASAMAVLLRTPLVGFPVGGLVGPGTLLYGLAAATFARLRNPTTALAGGIAVGVVEQATVFGTGRSTSADIALFVLIVVALAAQRARSGRAEDDGTWLPAREVARLDGLVAASRRVRWVRAGASAVVAAVVVILPLLLSPGQATRMTALCAFGVVALSAVVVTGWSGQLSLGQVGVAGVGAAVAGGLVTRGGFGSDMFVVFAIAAAVGAVASVVVGLPAVRLRGPQLAIITLAFAFAVPAAMSVSGISDWLMPDGPVTRPELFGWIDLAPDHRFTYVALSLVVVSLACARRLRASRVGRLVLAGRDDLRVAAGVGTDPVRVRLFAFAVSGALAGAAGAVIAWNQGVVEPAAFAPQRSLDLVAAVVIGGISSPLGALVGVGWVFGLPMIFSGSPYVAALGSGAGVLAVLMVQPAGLAVIAGDAWRRVASRLAGVSAVTAVRGGTGRDLDVSDALEASGRSPNAERLLRRLELEPDAAPASDVAPEINDGSFDVVGNGRSASVVTEALPSSDGAPDAPDLDNPDGDGGSGPVAMLEVEGLLVDRGANRVIDGLQFRVERGDAVALVGTNGAGKSTLLDAIAGDLRARRGTIRAGGIDVTRSDPGRVSELGVAVHPGARACFPDLTVDEHFEVASTFRTLPVGVDEIYQRYPRLRDRRDVAAGALSGGERHLLGFALAALSEPDLLLVDELSLGLAPDTLAELVAAVDGFRSRGCTVVVVDQRLDHLVDVVDRAVYLERGRIAMEGPSAQMLEWMNRDRSDAPPSDVDARSSNDIDDASDGLVVRGLSVSYGAVEVLHGVDLHVPPATVVGVIGGNGAGKTTLLDAVAGDVAHDGFVSVDGVDIAERSSARRAALGLGRTFQGGSGLDALTVKECLTLAQDRNMQPRSLAVAAVGLPAAIVAETDAGLRAELLAASAGLLEWLDTPSGDLSTGLRRRLELHMAAAHDPSVLIADEPTSGVAVAETDGLADLIRSLAERGTAVVVVDHDREFIDRVADRVVEMVDGRLV